ncbi:MAG: hypothetical protein M1839_001010 [Geoglossum umbratile]|nr:MAG: hypothetical protein M1839_001010 [Geoglossum umbratile]
MAQPGGKPDLIVGVDFGMTYTGVSYAYPNSFRRELKVIQRWPGRHKTEVKVPTKLLYHRHRNRDTSLSAWGFECPIHINERQESLRDWFKLLLIQKHLDDGNRDRLAHNQPPVSAAEVGKWLEDFLRNIYTWTRDELSQRISWDSSNVVFLFSVPTTWESQKMLSRIEGIIRKAGFGSCPNHTVEVGLTEAEAAAVYTVDTGQEYMEGEAMLVCDAGGGTTVLLKSELLGNVNELTDMKDISVVKVVSAAGGRIKLDSLLAVEGMGVGSTEIDNEFFKLAEDRLSALGLSQRAREFVASEIMHGDEFQSNKCGFNNLGITPEYVLKIPNLPNSAELNREGIPDPEIVITRAEMKGFFDKQINKIFKLIDKQLRQLRESNTYRSEQITKIVLSGGLGSSPYVREQIIARYPDKEVILADEPQRYDSKKHKGQKPVRDAQDGKKYVDGQILWLINKGVPIPVDNPITHQFFRLISPTATRGTWKDKIFKSNDPVHLRPNATSDALQCCEIESDLRHIQLSEFVEKKKKLFRKGSHHFHAGYDVKVIVDGAQIRFELWFKGTNYTREKPILIEWGPAEDEQGGDPPGNAYH